MSDGGSKPCSLSYSNEKCKNHRGKSVHLVRGVSYVFNEASALPKDYTCCSIHISALILHFVYPHSSVSDTKMYKNDSSSFCSSKCQLLCAGSSEGWRSNSVFFWRGDLGILWRTGEWMTIIWDQTRTSWKAASY